MQKALQLFTPARILVSGFLFLILMGSILLSLPIVTNDGQGLHPIDAVFTATSAVCVTGLVVVDTGTHFNLLGQMIILTLIQVGGLGFMTVTTLIALVLGRKIGLRQRILIQESMNHLSTAGVVRLTIRVIMTTLLIESIGALVLFYRFLPHMDPTQAAYFGMFHAISAFANAGFDLMGGFRSFTDYSTDLVISFTLPILFILSGLGFHVLSDISTHRRGEGLSLHSKVALSMTGLLILLGVIGFLALEWTNPDTIQGLSVPGKLLAGFFQGVTPRTAGFSTLDYGDLRRSTLFFISFLMFIGASPGGTGGGVKTTTVAALLLAVRSELTGRSEIEVYQRRLPHEVVVRALVIVTIAICLIVTITLILSLTEQQDFIIIFFEVVSAFGTVGLSTGITPDLSYIARFLIIVLMYVGRVGPMTLGLALTQRHSRLNRRFPEERIVVG